MAERISDFAMEVQNFVSGEISPEQMKAFYRIFGMLLENFDRFAGQQALACIPNDKGEKAWQ